MLSLKVRLSKKLALILQNIVGIAKNMCSFFLFHRENICWHICGNDVFYSMKFSKYTQDNPEDIKMNIKRSQWSKSHRVVGTLFFHIPLVFTSIICHSIGWYHPTPNPCHTFIHTIRSRAVRHRRRSRAVVSDLGSTPKSHKY